MPLGEKYIKMYKNCKETSRNIIHFQFYNSAVPYLYLPCVVLTNPVPSERYLFDSDPVLLILGFLVNLILNTSSFRCAFPFPDKTGILLSFCTFSQLRLVNSDNFHVPHTF